MVENAAAFAAQGATKIGRLETEFGFDLLPRDRLTVRRIGQRRLGGLNVEPVLKGLQQPNVLNGNDGRDRLAVALQLNTLASIGDLVYQVRKNSLLPL